MTRPQSVPGSCASLLAALVFPPALALADTLTVCPSACDSTTVQGAIDVASPGDTILIATAGTITEAEIVVDTPVTIVGFVSTVLQAGTARGQDVGRVLTIASGTDVELRDLVLRHGDVTGSGGAILNQGNLTLRSVTIELSDATNGGAIFNQGSLVAVDCLLQDSSAVLGGLLYNEGTAFLGLCHLDDGLAGSGAGIYNTGSLSLESVYISSNDATGGWGGGIYQPGTEATLSVHRAELSYNLASYGAGLALAGGTAEIVGAFFQNNTATTLGGGARISSGATRFAESTFHNNSAFDGGGVYQESSSRAHFVNVTLSSNVAHNHGGGIYVAAKRRVDLASCTVAGNVADSDASGSGDGGGIYVDPCTGICAVSYVDLKNSVVAENIDSSPGGALADDCSGHLNSDGYNLIGVAEGITPCQIEGSATGLNIGGDSFFHPIQDNGGLPTFPGRPAPWTRNFSSPGEGLNAGNPAGCTDYDDLPLDYDQRHAGRVGVCDLGAYEKDAQPPIFVDGFEAGSSGWWTNP